MTSFKDLKAQAELLLAQAEEARKREAMDAIAVIKTTMAEYGLTLSDLKAQGVNDPQPNRRNLTASPQLAKYKGPAGQLWSGGRGRKPEWVYEILKSGGNLESFRIHSH